MNRTETETALDNSTIWALMGNGRYWKLRRNGATKTWKRDPDRFQIPVKAGLRSCAYLTNDTDFTTDFIVSKEDPNQ